MRFGGECGWTGSLAGLVMTFVLIVTFLAALLINIKILIFVGFFIVIGIAMVMHYNETSKSDD